VEVIAETGSAAYLSLLRALLDHGEETSPRGLPTRELLDVTVTILDPAEVHVLSTGRHPSAAIAATEAAHLVAGLSSLEQLDLASGGRFSQFADRGRLRGAYGPRTRAQLQRIAGLLERDPSTRQAVATVWNGMEAAAGKDVPCTLSYQFLIRGGALQLRTLMRSNDLWLGAPYDWEFAGVLQRTLAAALGIPAGAYTHAVGSAHFYERDREKVEKVIAEGFAEANRAPAPAFFSDGAAGADEARASQRWASRSAAAERVVLRPASASLSANLWYTAHVPALPISRHGWQSCVFCHYVTDGMCPECQP